MKIWHLDCDVNNYDYLCWKDGADIDFIQSFDGRKHNKNKFERNVEFIYNDRPIGNTIGLASNIPIFDEEAWNNLKDLIENDVELLRIEVHSNTYYAINVLTVLDCIDYTNSVYKTFKDSERIMRFSKYSFKEDVVNGFNIFKIMDETLKAPFVSEAFRKRVMDMDLKGFVFCNVYE